MSEQPKKITLTQRLVTRYAKYNALKNRLESWLKNQRDGILEALKRGEKCPDRGPYVIELGGADARVDWKEEFRRWLWKNGKTKEMAENILQQVEKKPRAKQLRLECKINPLYGQKFVPKLP